MVQYMLNDKDGAYGYDAFAAGEQFQNPLFGSVDHNPDNVYGEEDGNKRLRLTQTKEQEGEDINIFKESSSLGLTLSKTPSFVNLLEMSLSQGNKPNSTTERGANRGKVDDPSQQPSEKLKASNFCISLLKIGGYERVTRNEGDLVAKCYYAKKKLVWEILDRRLKIKIEIQWSDILAIRANTPENEPGILEVELNQPPAFFRETNPQPRKHTLWQLSEDFTNGQARAFRRHYLTFPPGVLDRHYEKLLQCDNRLLTLSQKPFPSLESPFFQTDSCGITDYSFNINANRPQIPHGLQFSLPNMCAPPRFPAQQVHSIRQTIEPLQPISAENISNHGFQNPRTAFWGYGTSNIVTNVFPKREQIQQLHPIVDHIPQLPPIASPTLVAPAPNYHDYNLLPYGEVRRPQPDPTFAGIEEHLLGDMHVVYPDEAKVLKKVMSMGQLLDQSALEMNPSINNGIQQVAYQQDRIAGDHLVHNATDHFNGDYGLHYPQPVNWVPSQLSNGSQMIRLPSNNSLYTYSMPAPRVEGFDAAATKNDSNQFVGHPG